MESYQKDVSNDIKSEVERIKIANYEVVRAERVGFKDYRVLVKADKAKLFEGLKNETDRALQLLEARESKIAGEHALKRLSFYNNAKKRTQRVLNNISVMKVLRPSFHEAPYLRKIEAIDRKYKKTKSRISFTVGGGNASLRDVIKAALSKEGMRIGKKGAEPFYVKLHADIKKARSYGFFLARSSITITTRDKNGNIAGSGKLNITGQSTQGYAIAVENIAVKLQKRLQKEGLWRVLGITM